jgi:hypothetical protein
MTFRPDAIGKKNWNVELGSPLLLFSVLRVMIAGLGVNKKRFG